MEGKGWSVEAGYEKRKNSKRKKKNLVGGGNVWGGEAGCSCRGNSGDKAVVRGHPLKVLPGGGEVRVLGGGRCKRVGCLWGDTR